jgi:hypothetical protein
MRTGPNDHEDEETGNGGSWLIEDVVNGAIETAADIATDAMGLDTEG